MRHKRNSNIDEDLRERVGHDATNTFESDPDFVESDPTENAGTKDLNGNVYACFDDQAEIENPEGEEDAFSESDEDMEILGVDEVSTDVTRLEGGGQSGRGRGRFRNPRRAA